MPFFVPFLLTPASDRPSGHQPCAAQRCRGGDFDRHPPSTFVVSAANGSAVATTGEDGKPVVAVQARAQRGLDCHRGSSRSGRRSNSIRAALWRSLVLIAIGIAFALSSPIGGPAACGGRFAAGGRRRTIQAAAVRPSHHDRKRRRIAAIGNQVQPDGGGA